VLPAENSTLISLHSTSQNKVQLASKALSSLSFLFSLHDKNIDHQCRRGVCPIAGSRWIDSPGLGSAGGRRFSHCAVTIGRSIAGAENARNVDDERRKPVRMAPLSLPCAPWQRDNAATAAVRSFRRFKKCPINTRRATTSAGVSRWEKFRGRAALFAPRRCKQGRHGNSVRSARSRRPVCARVRAYVYACGPRDTPRRYHNPVTPNIDFDTYT
jgi:hypothetical protein